MLILSGLFRLIGDCLSFVGPLLINEIVDYAYEAEEKESHSTSDVLFSQMTNTSGNSTAEDLKVKLFYLVVKFDKLFYFVMTYSLIIKLI